jgi:O-antigen/teichoic acid export membrane protein
LIQTVYPTAATFVERAQSAILATRWGSRLQAVLRGSRGKTLLALVDQVIVGAANFVTLLLLGRLAGAENLGLFALVMTVFYLLMTVQESLVTLPYTIVAAKLKGERHLQCSGAALTQSATWAAFVGVAIAIVGVSMYWFGDDAQVAGIVGAFALVAPIWLIREFTRRFLFANMRLTRVVAMSIAGATTQVIALGLWAYSGRLSAVTALYAMGMGSSVAGFGWLWLSRREFDFHRERSSYFVLKNWVLGRWIVASQATNVVASNMMLWLIAFWLGPTATGVFAACDSILRMANPIIMSLNNILTPWAAIGFHRGGKAKLNQIVWKSTALLGLFLLGFTFAVSVTGGWILGHSYGSSYAEAWATLVVLAVNQLVAKLSLATGRALLVLERADINLIADLAGFATALIAAPLLLPMYGILGGACALLAGSLAMSGVNIAAYVLTSRNDKPEVEYSIGPVTGNAVTVGGVSE